MEVVCPSPAGFQDAVRNNFSQWLENAPSTQRPPSPASFAPETAVEFVGMIVRSVHPQLVSISEAYIPFTDLLAVAGRSISEDSLARELAERGFDLRTEQRPWPKGFGERITTCFVLGVGPRVHFPQSPFSATFSRYLARISPDSRAMYESHKSSFRQEYADHVKPVELFRQQVQRLSGPQKQVVYRALLEDGAFEQGEVDCKNAGRARAIAFHAVRDHNALTTFKTNLSQFLDSSVAEMATNGTLCGVFLEERGDRCRLRPEESADKCELVEWCNTTAMALRSCLKQKLFRLERLPKDQMRNVATEIQFLATVASRFSTLHLDNSSKLLSHPPSNLLHQIANEMKQRSRVEKVVQHHRGLTRNSSTAHYS